MVVLRIVLWCLIFLFMPAVYAQDGNELNLTFPSSLFASQCNKNHCTAHMPNRKEIKSKRSSSSDYSMIELFPGADVFVWICESLTTTT